MSSELFLRDHSFQISPSEIDLQCFPDPDRFFPLQDLSVDLLQTMPINSITEHQSPPLSDPSSSLHFSAPLPPPCTSDMDSFDGMRVKMELSSELEVNSAMLPLFSSDDIGFMQRSLSTRSLDRKPSLFSQYHSPSLSETPNTHSQASNFVATRKLEGFVRKVSCTGDLQKINIMQANYEAVGYRVRRYSPEERKQRIHRYRTKRTQRNFNKTIKYACRKTLADSRPRVRGRFARNDEIGEIPKVAGSVREQDDEEELWVDTLQEEEEQMALKYFGSGVSPHFQHLGFLPL